MDSSNEFNAHLEPVVATGIKMYFSEPYLPWRHGTNEKFQWFAMTVLSKWNFLISLEMLKTFFIICCTYIDILPLYQFFGCRCGF